MKAGPDASRIRRKSPYQSSFPHVHPSRSKIGAKSASGEKTTHNCAARAQVFALCAHDLRSLAASATASSLAASAFATTPSFARIRSKHRAQCVEHAAPPSAAAAAQRLRPRRPRVAAAARSIPRRASRIARAAAVVASTLFAVRVAIARRAVALAARAARDVDAIDARDDDAVDAHRADADATRSSVVVTSRHRRIVVVDRDAVTRRGLNRARALRRLAPRIGQSSFLLKRRSRVYPKP